MVERSKTDLYRMYIYIYIFFLCVNLVQLYALVKKTWSLRKKEKTYRGESRIPATPKIKFFVTLVNG